MDSLKFLFGIKRFVAFFFAFCFITTLFTGCSKQSRSFFTTVFGTSVGSTIGAAVSKDKKKGAIIGAVVGGVAGTAASIALGGGVISIAYGAVTTIGNVLANCFARKKNKKIKKEVSQVDVKSAKTDCTTTCINEK